MRSDLEANRPFPHPFKQRHQLETRVDKIQWFTWNCRPEPRPHFLMFAHWSVMRERSIGVSPKGFSGSGIPLTWSSGFSSKLVASRSRRWDAKYNHHDYGIARNFGSGLRDWRTLLGIPFLNDTWEWVWVRDVSCFITLRGEPSFVFLLIREGKLRDPSPNPTFPPSETQMLTLS